MIGALEPYVHTVDPQAIEVLELYGVRGGALPYPHKLGGGRGGWKCYKVSLVLQHRKRNISVKPPKYAPSPSKPKNPKPKGQASAGDGGGVVITVN